MSYLIPVILLVLKTVSKNSLEVFSHDSTTDQNDRFCPMKFRLATNTRHIHVPEIAKGCGLYNETPSFKVHVPYSRY